MKDYQNYIVIGGYDGWKIAQPSNGWFCIYENWRQVISNKH